MINSGADFVLERMAAGDAVVVCSALFELACVSKGS